MTQKRNAPRPAHSPGWITAGLLTVLAVILSACASPAPPTTEAPAISTPAATEAPATPIPATTVAPATAVPATTEAPSVTEAGPTTTTGQEDTSVYPDQPEALLPTPSEGDPSVTANISTTIRSGPGDSYPVYGTFLGGKTAQAVGKSEDGSWWVVSVPVAPSGQGWVSAEWVTAENADSLAVIATPPVPPTAEFTPPGPDDPQVKALTEVYVRTGPGDQYPAYGVAKTGQAARVIGKSEDGQWWVVRINPEMVGAGHGWIAVAFTEAQNTDEVAIIKAPPPPTPVAVPAPPSGAATVTVIDFVNVRSGPGVDYTVLGVAAPGATGEVAGVSADGQWWQVKVPTTISTNGLAWVSAGFVSTQNTENVPVVEDVEPAPVITATPQPPSSTQCTLVSQEPADGSVLAPDTDFDMKWVVQNTSGAAWDMNTVDILFAGALGTRIHQGADVYDLGTTVEAEATYELVLDALAPSTPGEHGEAWVIAEGDTVLCPLWMLIEVQE